MTVRSLIIALSSMPQDAEVSFVYDSAIRGDIHRVFVCQEGKVVLSDNDVGAKVYDEEEQLDPSYPYIEG